MVASDLIVVLVMRESYHLGGFLGNPYFLKPPCTSQRESARICLQEEGVRGFRASSLPYWTLHAAKDTEEIFVGLMVRSPNVHANLNVNLT